MNRNMLLCFALTPCISCAAAWAADVKTDFDHSVNFSQYHTYSWGPVKTSDPLNEHRVRAQVNRDLQAKGWQMVPSGGNATIVVSGNVKNEQELETMYNGMGGGMGGWGGGWGWGGWGDGWGNGGFVDATTTTTQQPVGHLVLDIFATTDHKLLFRGIADGDVHNNSSKNTKTLDKDINKMFKDFPPKSKS